MKDRERKGIVDKVINWLDTPSKGAVSEVRWRHAAYGAISPEDIQAYRTQQQVDYVTLSEYPFNGWGAPTLAATLVFTPEIEKLNRLSNVEIVKKIRAEAITRLARLNAQRK